VTYDNETHRYFNSMIALGLSSGQYNKTRLVPFGEYVPFESMLRGLIKFFDLPMSSIAIGEVNQHPFSVQGHFISAAICYEVVYPDLVARNSIDSSIIMTVSNDAWFGRSIGPKQHMQMAQMRALENAKPLMRGTNNGISALVDHRGRIYQKIEQHQSSELSGIVQARVGATAFSKFRSWPTLFIVLLVCIVLIRTKNKIEIAEVPTHVS
jgi:apolipoprotein N-acyltransferase